MNNPISIWDNPAAVSNLVYLTDVATTALEREIAADALAALGYPDTAKQVREGRTGADEFVPEVKFAGDPESGIEHGIDTSYGHRWTIRRVGGKYQMTDHKLGLTASADNPYDLKGAALRVVGAETDKTPNEPYGDLGASPAGEGQEQPNLDQLRTLFPGHYLTK